MLDRKQRNRVIELFEDGVKMSEIAAQVGVSRQSVYNVIRDDFKKDPELVGLEKELKKTKLLKQIEELKKPLRTKDELDNAMIILNKLIIKVQHLWYACSDITAPQYCVYCGGELKGTHWVNKKGIGTPGLVCKKCKREFPFFKK